MNPSPPQRDAQKASPLPSSGHASLLRLMDANRNRAAEALRVVEDVCRLHWELPGLARQLKDLRHSVLGATLAQDPHALLQARDIEGDVGRTHASPGAAPDVHGLAVRNLQRAKEALRTLEEAARVAAPAAAAELEKSRYRLYGLEKALLSLSQPANLADRLDRLKICLLATTQLSILPLEEAVEGALRGGVQMVQLREKEMSDRELLRVARNLRELTASHGALFLINDRPDIALLCHADGVHVGQDDVPVGLARRLLGPTRLVGASTHSLEQALEAERAGADYVGVGPVFATSTKEVGPPLGPEAAALIACELRVPALAIGGIQVGNAGRIAAAGLRRIAVSSALLGKESPESEARRLGEALAVPGAADAPGRKM